MLATTEIFSPKQLEARNCKVEKANKNKTKIYILLANKATKHKEKENQAGAIPSLCW